MIDTDKSLAETTSSQIVEKPENDWPRELAMDAFRGSKEGIIHSLREAIGNHKEEFDHLDPTSQKAALARVFLELESYCKTLSDKDGDRMDNLHKTLGL